MELDPVPETSEQQWNLDLPAVSCHSAIFTLVDNQLMLLLVERNEGPFRFQWELPGTALTTAEDLSATAMRASTPPLAPLPLAVNNPRQLGAYGGPARDPRHRSIAVIYWGVTHHTNINTGPSGPQLVPMSEWTSDGFRFAFDHQQIADDALIALKESLNSTSLATRLCASAFTISELQRVYEVVFNTEIAAGNFHRKVQSTPGFTTAVGNQNQEPKRRGRPAQRFEATNIVDVSPPFHFESSQER
ncbi:MAG: hypothetical protein QF696_11370 [Acidimicrobiales bacterium]|nr:hypothetical protein [Acidimicrobiales bacterium]